MQKTKNIATAQKNAVQTRNKIYIPRATNLAKSQSAFFEVYDKNGDVDAARIAAASDGIKIDNTIREIFSVGPLVNVTSEELNLSAEEEKVLKLEEELSTLRRKKRTNSILAILGLVLMTLSPIFILMDEDFVVLTLIAMFGGIILGIVELCFIIPRNKRIAKLDYEVKKMQEQWLSK